MRASGSRSFAIDTVNGTTIAATTAAAPAAHAQRDWYQCAELFGTSISPTTFATGSSDVTTVSVRRSRSRPSAPNIRVVATGPAISTTTYARAPTVRAWINSSSCDGGTRRVLPAASVVSPVSSTRVPHGA